MRFDSAAITLTGRTGAKYEAEGIFGCAEFVRVLLTNWA